MERVRFTNSRVGNNTAVRFIILVWKREAGEIQVTNGNREISEVRFEYVSEYRSVGEISEIGLETIAE